MIGRILGACAVALSAMGASASEEPPRRVVSMNLCTDQLALMMAEPGQLIAVSNWATRPSASNMAEAASKLIAHGGSAEQIFLLKPDLVIAGTFTNGVTIDMLRRLGIRVEQLPSARSFAETAALMRRMGALLGAEERAEEMVAAFDAALDAQAARAAGLPKERAAYHYPNNYTSGANTLADEVMARAGFENAAAALGLRGAARIALETLVMTEPFLIQTSHISDGRIGRSYESAHHPALRSLRETGRSATIAERWQVCGTPWLAMAVEALLDQRSGGAAVGERE